MDWLKKHADAAVTISFIVGAALWMNSSLHALDEKLSGKINTLEKEMAVMKTVLIMQDVMPKDLVVSNNKGDK